MSTAVGWTLLGLMYVGAGCGVMSWLETLLKKDKARTKSETTGMIIMAIVWPATLSGIFLLALLKGTTKYD